MGTKSRRVAAAMLVPLVMTGVIAGLSGSAGAARYSGSGDPYMSQAYCGTMSGPLYTYEVTVYSFVYSINGGAWQYSSWYATRGVDNWQWVNGSWQWRQTVQQVTLPAPGDTVTMWAYVGTPRGQDWVYLGQCTRGGIVMM